MNESEPVSSLDNEMSFIHDLKQLLERASEMKEATVPMHCFIPRLGVYLSNHAAVHKNSLNTVERNDSAAVKPVEGAQPSGEHNNESMAYHIIRDCYYAKDVNLNTDIRTRMAIYLRDTPYVP